MKRMIYKLAISAIAMFGLSSLTNLSLAGELDPGTAPAPTMKTLQEIYDAMGNGDSAAAPIWQAGDWVFTDWEDNPRFAVSEGEYPLSELDDLVWDKATGLIWTRNADMASYLSHPWCPDFCDVQSSANGPFTFGDAHSYCRSLDVSDLRAWRLPTVEELSSLLNVAFGSAGIVPGHPFINVDVSNTSYYWTSTTRINHTLRAWVVFLDSGGVGVLPILNPSNVLCVRGGSGRTDAAW